MPTYAQTPQPGSLEPSESSNNNNNNNNHPKPIVERKRSSASGQSSLSSQSSSNATNSNSNDETRSSMMLNSSADYDHIRNTTLMFFLDRLFIASKDGREARTLHDLSCLFGTRDFTKEMRQIVGASRNGLKKFLQSYPSLFTIEGDKVYLTQLEQESSTPARDYNQEAVDYFTQKLLQFGTALVPIRNLFGYRSQASQEVRHVSGKNTKEFRQFLAAHSDVFEMLADQEHVILKSAFKELETRGGVEHLLKMQAQANQVGSPSDSAAAMDPYLNKQFAHSLEQCMKKLESEAESETATPTPCDDDNDDEAAASSDPGDKKEQTKIAHRVSLECLHERITRDCNNQLFLSMVKTIEDLKVFLRMHPKIFKRIKCDEDQRDYVSLLSEAERQELKAQAYPSLQASRSSAPLKRSETNESNLSSMDAHLAEQQPVSLPSQNLSKAGAVDETEEQSGSSVQQVNSRKNSATSINNNSKDARSKTSSQSNINTNSSGHSSLRATAPPFVPSNRQPKSTHLPAGNQNGQPALQPTSNNSNKTPIQRSVSNLNPSTGARQRHANLPPTVDQRLALRSYLLKASAENELYSPTKHLNGHTQTKVDSVALTRQRSSPLARNQGGAGDDLRARTVNIVREASNIVSRIMSSAEAVALDCNGYNLGFNGQITMIQFGFLPKSSANNTSGHDYLHHHNQLLSSALASRDSAVNGGGGGKENGHEPIKEKTAEMKNAAKLHHNNQLVKPEVCVFDLVTNPELVYCLKPLLESDKIVKIVHDVRNKSNLLYSQFGIMLNHVFDTQVANLVIQQQETGKPAYKSRYISMSRLCEIYGHESLMKFRNAIKSKHSAGSQQQNHSSSGRNKDVNYWLQRPLTDAMIYESTMDVYCLVGGVYQNLKSKIKPEYKPLFEQLNLEGVLARIKPEEIRSVKRERKIDFEVIDLKRKLYSDSKGSIVLSNREIRLLRHIDLTEEVRQKIQQCEKVAKKLERLDMKAAQNAQSLGTLSTDGDPNSLEPNSSNNTNGIQTNTSPSISQATGDASLQVDQLRGDQHNERLASESDDLGATGMGNLMDSSMFDELKDKMIESSSLLESLEDDDDDVGCGGATGEPVSIAHLEHHDNCRCNCHRGSTSGASGNKSNPSSSKSTSSLSSSSSSSSLTPPQQSAKISDEQQQVKEEEATKEEPSQENNKAVDMAVQCDLLS